MRTYQKHICLAAISASMAFAFSHATAGEEIGSVPLSRISTPDTVETSIGTLNYIDGAPLPATSRKIYDYLDTMRGVDAFLKGIPGASVQGMMEGPRVIGQKTSSDILIFDKLADSRSLYLTTNTSTMYIFANLDLKVDGPTVIDYPPGMLGAFQDAWFRYIGAISARLGRTKVKVESFWCCLPAMKVRFPKAISS